MKTGASHDWLSFYLSQYDWLKGSHVTKVVWFPNETDYSYCELVVPNTPYSLSYSCEFGILYSWNHIQSYEMSFTMSKYIYLWPCDVLHFQLCLTLWAELMKSKFVCRPSSVRSCHNCPSTWYTDFFQTLFADSPGPYAATLFYFVMTPPPLSHFNDFFHFVFINMEPSKPQKFPLQIAPESFLSNFSWIFFLNGPHKTTFGIFEILKKEIFNFFFSFSLTWYAMGVKCSKH